MRGWGKDGRSWEEKVWSEYIVWKKICNRKEVEHRSGEMAQDWRALAALAEHPGLVPSTHALAHKHLQLQGSVGASCIGYACGFYPYIQGENTHKIKKKNLLKQKSKDD